MKPESWPVAEDTHWKSWKFKEIITGAMEQDNLRIRKEIASFEEKYTHLERLHNAVKSELETDRSHKADLQKALDNSYSFIKIREKEVDNLKKALRAVVRQKDRLKNILKRYRGSGGSVMDNQSGPSPF
jgi:chromosome segregation ATPase